MGTSFSDITIYTASPFRPGTAEYWEDRALINFISDLYMQKMHGYKPPKTSRITIQPDFHGIWDGPWKFGAIASVAPFYSYDEYAACDRKGRYMYVLDLIQRSTIPLSEEFGWDKLVFENAYREVLQSDFRFRIEYPAKRSRDRKKEGSIIIEKTETITSLLVHVEINELRIEKKLFEKKNDWCFDAVYELARCSKWFDTDRFGISYDKGRIKSWYSIARDEVSLFGDVDFFKPTI